MRFSNISTSGTRESVAVNVFRAMTVRVAPPDSGTVVKAGSPLTADGAVTTGSGAVGILLYDVDTAANPNGAVLVHGILDAAKAQAHSGVTYVDALYSALPLVTFRTDIGAQEGGDGEPEILFDSYEFDLEQGSYKANFTLVNCEADPEEYESYCVDSTFTKELFDYYNPGDILDWSDVPYFPGVDRTLAGNQIISLSDNTHGVSYVADFRTYYEKDYQYVLFTKALDLEAGTELVIAKGTAECLPIPFLLYEVLNVSTQSSDVTIYFWPTRYPEDGEIFAVLPKIAGDTSNPPVVGEAKPEGSITVEWTDTTYDGDDCLAVTVQNATSTSNWLMTVDADGKVTSVLTADDDSDT